MDIIKNSETESILDIEMNMEGETKVETKTEEQNGYQYIHQLTMQTMVNRDVLRKINERKQRTNNQEQSMTLKQLQGMVLELWEITQTKEFSLDMNSSYPYELQNSFNQFVGHTRAYLEKHPEIMNLSLSPNNKEEKKGENDTKEIHMSPIFMEKKHPLWNYNHFNRKNAIHAYPPNSRYHIPTAKTQSIMSFTPTSSSNWKYERNDVLFGDVENV